jgi:hypothetical protein
MAADVLNAPVSLLTRFSGLLINLSPLFRSANLSSIGSSRTLLSKEKEDFAETG